MGEDVFEQKKLIGCDVNFSLLCHNCMGRQFEILNPSAFKIGDKTGFFYYSTKCRQCGDVQYAIEFFKNMEPHKIEGDFVSKDRKTEKVDAIFWYCPECDSASFRLIEEYTCNITTDLRYRYYVGECLCHKGKPEGKVILINFSGPDPKKVYSALNNFEPTKEAFVKAFTQED